MATKNQVSNNHEVNNEQEESLEVPEPDSYGEETQDTEDVRLIASVLESEIDPEELMGKSSTLETGKYKWESKPTIDVNFSDKDIKSSDLAQRKGSSKGRCFIKVSGNVTGEVQGVQRKAHYEFTCSPDLRIKEDGKHDPFSQAYGHAVSLFFQKYERNPKQEMEVVKLLESGNYLMTITKGRSGGNFLNRLERQ